jgi:hypothetical protein
MFALERTLPLIRDHLMYVIRWYKQDGISVLVQRDPKRDSVVVMYGDWAGNPLDLEDFDDEKVNACLKFTKSDLGLFVEMMKLIGLPQAQYFLSLDDELTLVDMQVSLNKLAGPGMLRDIFSRRYPTQEVIKVEPFDDRVIEYAQRGTGTYEGDLIIKPSRFATIAEDDLVPLYTEIRRA